MKLTRKQIQDEHIPAGYNPTLHIVACAVSSVAPIVVALWQLHDVALWHLSAFFGTIIITNGGEYLLHRVPFHTPLRGPLRALYHRHTTMHHNMFDHETMPYTSPRDLKWMLLPAWGYTAVLIIMSPVFALLYSVEPNLAWMMLIAQSLYYIVYEVLHTASHLPPEHWLARPRVVRWASRHHTVHHNPKLMRRYNFNFALPLFDLLLNTLHVDDAAQRTTS